MAKKALKLPSFKTKMAFEFRISKDFKLLAHITGSALILIDIDTGKEIVQFKDFKHPSSIAFANNSQSIALKTTSGKIGIYNIEELKLLKSFVPTKQEGCNFFFSPDDQYLIDADWNGSIVTIDLSTNKIEIIRQYKTYIVESIDYKDNKFLFLISPSANHDTGRVDRDVILLEWEYPFNVNNPIEIIMPHNWQRIVKYSHKSNLIAIDEKEELCIYNLESRKAINRIKFTEHIKDFAWSHDDKHFAIVWGDKIQLYNFDDFSLKKEIQMQYSCFVDFSTCGRFILISSWNRGYFLTMEDFFNLE